MGYQYDGAEAEDDFGSPKGSDTARAHRLNAALDEIETAVKQAIARGESYSYRTSSSPVGIPAGTGVISSVRGDLCDLRDEIERIVRRARAI